MSARLPSNLSGPPPGLANSDHGCCYAMVVRLMCCFLQHKMESCLPPQVQCACCVWRTMRDWEKRRQLRAPIGSKIVNSGAVFHVGVDGSCFKLNALYGAPNEQVLHLNRDPQNPEMAVFRLDHKSVFSEGESRTIQPREGVALIPQMTGAILALRMAGRSYPFRSQRCNSQHYVDYLTYGRTFGSYYTWCYLPASEDCPVFAELNDRTDTNYIGFVLEDFHKKRHYLNPPLQRLPDLAVGKMASVRNVGSRIIERSRSCLPCAGGSGFPPPSP